MLLLDLPNELLTHIASFLAHDCHLAPLVQTHPAFYQLLNRALYELNRRNVRGYETEGRNTPPELALIWAVVNNRLATVKRVISLGIDLNQRTPPGHTILHFACEQNALDVVRLLLDSGGVDASLRERGHRSPLHVAASSGHANIVRSLLDYNRQRLSECPGDTPLIDVDSADFISQTPLMVAARSGYTDVVATLLTEEGIDPQHRDMEGDIPLLVASNKDHLGVVEVMLASDKVDPNAATSSGQTTLVSEMVFGQNEEALRILLASDRVDIHKPAPAWPYDNTLWTPFEVACMSPNLLGAEMLIDAGLDPNSRGPEGRTPLHVAVDFRQTKIVAKLLSMDGIDVNAHDNNGNTPLHPVESGWREFEAQYEPGELQQRQRDITRMLLNTPGIDYEAINNNGETPLYSAIRCFDQRHTIELLADVTDVDLNGPICPASNLSALMLATESGHGDAFTTLAKHPKVDQHLSLENMPRLFLHDIISRPVYFPEMLGVLLEEGADLNERDERGMTPLLVSLHAGNLGMAYCILGRPELDASPCALECPGSRSFISKLMSYADPARSELWSYLRKHDDFDPNMVDYDGRTALTHIVEDGNVQQLNMLLATPGVDVNRADLQGLTPIHHALRALDPHQPGPYLTPIMCQNMISILVQHNNIDLSVFDDYQSRLIRLMLDAWTKRQHLGS